MSDICKAGTTCGYDMTKKIVMGPYYKYEENSPWFSHHGEVGEVKMIDGHLCHAVSDLELFEEEYDITIRDVRNSRRVIRWDKVGRHQVG